LHLFLAFVKIPGMETRIKALEDRVQDLTTEAEQNRKRVAVIAETLRLASDYSIEFKEAQTIMADAALQLKRSVR
jgi:hypothetical protein